MPTPLFSSPPKNICIVRLSAIGDVTHMMPIIATLQKEWPQTKITWIIGSVEYQLIKQLKDINFIIFNKSNGSKEYLNLIKQLKGQRFDALLMMQTSLRASMISLCIKAKHKIGFDKKRAHDYQNLFSHISIEDKENLHVLDAFFLFLQRIGITNQHMNWLLKADQKDHDFIANFTQNKPYVVVNPSSSIRKNNYRNWPLEHYVAVIDFLALEKKIQVVITGGPSELEKQLGQNIDTACQSKPINLIGKTSLMQLLACIADAQCLVAPDTGPAHMATVVDTPVIGLFASSNPLRTGPYKSLNACLNLYPKALNVYSNKTLEQATWGERVRHPDVMSLITVEMVKKKLNEFLI